MTCDEFRKERVHAKDTKMILLACFSVRFLFTVLFEVRYFLFDGFFICLSNYFV